MRPFHYITLFSVHQIWEDGKSLYEQELIYDKNLLNVEQYLDMYIHRQCMFDIMSKKQEFIQDIAKTGLYKQIDNVILIKPLFCLPQTADMMKFIWPMLSENEYSEYLMSIPEIATLDDSKNIKVFLCIDENMDKLGSYQLHDKIDHLLCPSRQRAAPSRSAKCLAAFLSYQFSFGT